MSREAEPLTEYLVDELDRGTTLYAGVADWMVTRLQRRVYRVGDRLPSIRALSAALRVSINTVREAYDLLERRRYVECRPQSGYFVRRMPPPEPGEPRRERPVLDPREVVFCKIIGEIKERTGTSKSANLAIAVPDPELLPAEKLGSIVADVMRRGGGRITEYFVTPGYRPLRERIADLTMNAGLSLSPDDVIITNGCSEAVFLTLASLCRPGDTIALESPTYFNFFQFARELGLKVLEIPSSPRDGMNLDTLRFAIAHHEIAACLAVPTYSNPTGSCLGDGAKRELVCLLDEAGIPLVEDDVHGELSFSHPRPPACKAFDATGNVVYCSSFSKTLGPGLRLGWVAPGRYRERIERRKTLMNVANPSIEQLAVSKFLEEGNYEKHVRRLRAALASRMEEVRDLIAESFPEGTRVSKPSGGFLLWIELPEGSDAQELYGLAMREDIVFPPGAIFTVTNAYDNFLRLNGGIRGGEADRIIRRIGALASTIVPKGTREREA